MPVRDFALLVLVCLAWALNNIVSKYVVSHLGAPPLLYAALRFGIVALAVFPWLWPMPRPRWRLLVVAVLMGGCNFALFFVGLKTATPSAAAVVLQLGVPMTVLLSFLMLGERMGRRRGLGVALTCAGAIAVIWDPQGLRLSHGLLFVVASTFFGSLGAVMMKQMSDVRPLQFQAWVGVASTPPLALASAVFEPGGWQAGLAAGWPFLAALLFSALAVSVAAHTIYFGLIQRHEANLISPLTLMTPLATIALGVLIFGDRFDLRMAVGAAVAIIGVLVIALRPNQFMAWLAGWRGPRAWPGSRPQ
jgi:O-acetylserine/cysteine efflux transporter